MIDLIIDFFDLCFLESDDVFTIVDADVLFENVVL